MPSLTVKTEFIDKLKQLNVYDKWLMNVKKQWNDEPILQTEWAVLIDSSFCFDETPEGNGFWGDIMDDSGFPGTYIFIANPILTP